MDAKTLRSSQIETAKTTTKINEIRGQCEGFAKNMLTKATEGRLAPDLETTWSAFSGMLASEQLEAADWGKIKMKVPGSHSKKVFDLPPPVVTNRANVPTGRFLLSLPSSKFARSSRCLRRGGCSKPRFFGFHFGALPGTFGFALARPPGSPGAAPEEPLLAFIF